MWQAVLRHAWVCLGFYLLSVRVNKIQARAKGVVIISKMFPTTTLPTDVCHLILSKIQVPLWQLARLLRVSRAWRDTLATYVARATPTETFYAHLVMQLALLGGCHIRGVMPKLEACALRKQLEEESAQRFASLAMLMSRFAKAEDKRYHVPVCVKLHKAFVATFSKRGPLRAFITWLRHETTVVKLDERRPNAVLNVDDKRRAHENSIKALEAADEKREAVAKKKRKLEERLGMDV